MAAVLAAKLLREAGVDCAVQSAGVYASPECNASAHAITAMREAGCDLLTHRSQRFTNELAAQAKIILTMTSAHQDAVLTMAPAAANKVFTLCEYAQAGTDVSDPFGGDLRVYQQCADQIERLLALSIGKMIQQI